MCVSPVVIKNPNYGLKDNGLRNVWDQMMSVPCGHCHECIAVRQSDFSQRILMESIKNEFFFCTLTYSNEMLPVFGTSLGYDVRFADVRDVTNMMKRLRKDNAFGVPFRYLAVSERGSFKGRPHFHILFIVDKQYVPDFNSCLHLETIMHPTVLQYWSRNYGTRKNPIYKPCCEYKSKFRGGKQFSNYDLHYVIPSLTLDGVSNVCYYVLKYMFKPSQFEQKLQQALAMNYSEEEFITIWSQVRSRVFHSIHLGLDNDPKVQEYIRNCIETTDHESPTPQFYSPVDGKPMPLSRQYRHNADIYTEDSAKLFIERSRAYFRDVNVHMQAKGIDDFQRKAFLAELTGASQEFDFIEDAE